MVDRTTARHSENDQLKLALAEARCRATCTVRSSAIGRGEVAADDGVGDGQGACGRRAETSPLS
jgi:hypothetical protein